MKSILSLMLLSALLLLGCEKEKTAPSGSESTEDYLIFGHFYGFCRGEECIQTYQLTATKLYEDTSDVYYNLEHDYSFVERSSEDFALASHLLDSFPTDLLDEEPEVIGCPDCADQGGLLLVYEINGIKRSWRIDNDRRNVPAVLHPYLASVDSVLTLLNP